MKQIVVEEKEKFSLPKEKTQPTVNMETCIIYGLPKCGKTTLLAELEDCLIIDTENGSNKVSGLIEKIPQNLGPVSKMKWLDEYADFLIAKGRPYDYVAIDTLSEVNDMAEWSGTWRYMNSTQGQKFNREKDEKGEAIKKGPMLRPSDADYESVHTLGDGYGYRWSREDTLRVFEKYTKVAKKCVFYVCHVEDKYVGGGDSRITLQHKVAPKQLALTGKVKDILARKVDAIGYVYNEDGIIKINFTGNEDRVGGNRCAHLRGYNDVADWKKIFIEE